MLKSRKLIVDTLSEVYQFLKPYADGEFWDLNQHEIVPGATYVVGRQQSIEHSATLRQLCESNTVQLVFCNTHEGSETLMTQLIYAIKANDLALDKKLLLLSGGDLDSRYKCLTFDHFVSKIFDYEENVAAAARIDDVFAKKQKPYKFLFLNGRHRIHRYWMIKKLESLGLLDQSIWTNLDNHGLGEHPWPLCSDSGEKIPPGSIPIKLLDPKYEYEFYKDQVNEQYGAGYAKYQLFKNQWGEIYINPAPYIDTYFSVVSETVFSYPHSFRTEKIWKPVAQGHPWIAVANAGYYRDIRNLGFQTFSHVIDESFDQIEDNFKRAERISQVIDDLCKQDLAKFLDECYTICKYNQQHLQELRLKIRQEFPDRFFQFINDDK